MTLTIIASFRIIGIPLSFESRLFSYRDDGVLLILRMVRVWPFLRI